MSVNAEVTKTDAQRGKRIKYMNQAPLPLGLWRSGEGAGYTVPAKSLETPSHSMFFLYFLLFST